MVHDQRGFVMCEDDAGEWMDADDDDDVTVPSKLKLKKALAWVARRNTAFVQITTFFFRFGKLG